MCACVCVSVCAYVCVCVVVWCKGLLESRDLTRTHRAYTRTHTLHLTLPSLPHSQLQPLPSMQPQPLVMCRSTNPTTTTPGGVLGVGGGVAGPSSDSVLCGCPQVFAEPNCLYVSMGIVENFRFFLNPHPWGAIYTLLFIGLDLRPPCPFSIFVCTNTYRSMHFKKSRNKTSQLLRFQFV